MKKVNLIVIFFAMLTGINLSGQDKKTQDQKSIKKMCGCYEVKFNFSETFQYSRDSAYKASADKYDGGLEWVELVEDKDDKIVLQHLLIVGPADKQHIIKHWRQDWLFENTQFYMFDHDNKWKFVELPKSRVKGQWTQKVYQVDDSPRYEGSASWVYVDGKAYWENTTDAPLPRREYTKRNDYNVTVRGNRQEIVNDGWIHDQNNKKVIRKEGEKDILVAEEKGYNTYTKVADKKCSTATKWWNTNGATWTLVRNEWDAAFARRKNLVLKGYTDDSTLYEILYDLPVTTSQAEISKVVKNFYE